MESPFEIGKSAKDDNLPSHASAMTKDIWRPTCVDQPLTTSYVPYIIESYTACRKEESSIEKTLDEIYWHLRYEKNFGSDGFRKIVEDKFVEQHSLRKRQLDYVLTELNFGIKLMNNDYGLNWHYETDASTGNKQLLVDLHDNSKGNKVIDTLVVNLPK
ncbi:MAG: hypothetical protein K2X77_30050 [Candidatus Obscuribacterales bacterium]|nr:hypothetical protein [Candidatus Obscuribacterales bacterium]